MATAGNVFPAFSGTQFVCEYCDYITCKKSHYNDHIETKKHFVNTSATTGNVFPAFLDMKKYTCGFCEKTYKNRSGLWRHNKQCGNNVPTKLKKSSSVLLVNTNNDDNNNNHENLYINDNTDNKMDKDEIILQLLKQNSELLELMKNGTNNCNNNNINSNNNTFNLHVFLNETCKDAMNITDFVDSIKLQLSDLERIGEIGYTQGISEIITSNLQALDVTQRPVHCTDKKRETIYVKDENQWIKEENNKPKIRKMIKHIENKNIQILPQFREKYPNYADPNSHDSDKYNKTIIEAMGGIGGSEIKENKIIRNISKVTTV